MATPAPAIRPTNVLQKEPFVAVLSSLHVHAVFLLTEGNPKLNPEQVQMIRDVLLPICLANETDMLQAQGFDDQLHLLLEYPATIAVADLLRALQDSLSAWRWTPTFFVASCQRPDLAQQMKRYLKTVRADNSSQQ